MRSREPNDLGVRLWYAGRYQEAAAAARHSVQSCRMPAAAGPSWHVSGLPAALNNLGAWLSSLGQHEEALAVTEEALSIRRKLAEADPATFEPRLASH